MVIPLPSGVGITTTELKKLLLIHLEEVFDDLVQQDNEVFVVVVFVVIVIFSY